MTPWIVELYKGAESMSEVRLPWLGTKILTTPRQYEDGHYEQDEYEVTLVRSNSRRAQAEYARTVIL